MIRLLLVEDHAMVRTALAVVLNREPDMTVVAEAGTLAEARTMLAGINVALIDLDLPDGEGPALIPELVAANPNAAAIALTGSRDQLSYARAIERGATGALYKAAPIDEVLSAIRRAAAGQPVHSQVEIIAFLQLAAQQRTRNAETERLLRELTPRERELLQVLAEGMSDRETAERLSVSLRTVQGHMLHLMDKLGVHSRLQALIVAVRHGLVHID